MEENALSALLRTYARALHTQWADPPILWDEAACWMFSQEDARFLDQQLTQAAERICPYLRGSRDDLLQGLVYRHLGYCVFGEQALQTAAAIGAKQYIHLGAGYDTFPLRQPAWAADLELFELDSPDIQQCKQTRLKLRGLTLPANVHLIPADVTLPCWEESLTAHPAFDRRKQTFCSLSNLAHCLDPQAFEALLDVLTPLLPRGSSLVFDFPSLRDERGRAELERILQAAGLEQKSVPEYSYRDMERLLSDHGFLIYEHLTSQEFTRQYFDAYNRSHPAHPIKAFAFADYCLAVRHR